MSGAWFDVYFLSDYFGRTLHPAFAKLYHILYSKIHITSDYIVERTG